MSRFSGRVWLQDKPLAYQLFVKLSVYSALVGAAAILYMAVCVFSAKQLTGEQWAEMACLFIMVLTVNLFISRSITARITEPFEKLAKNMGRIRNKNWKEKIYQVNRKDEVGRIINSLSAIQTNVNEINEDEELFYQSVSHGLKTPIMVIQNCCTAYQDGIYGDEAIDIIMHESVALEAGIKKLLYVSSFDHMLGKKSEFVAVDIAKLCEQCVKRFEAGTNGAAIELDVPQGIMINGNAEALETLFCNIIENAIRHVKTKIRIFLKEDGANYIIVFENDGKPIEQKTMEMLFDKFYKGPKGSFGLGLYIARKIAIFHGGDIWAENVENGVQFHAALKKYNGEEN